MKTLETERLVLRKFGYGDFDAVHSYAGCVENITYMLWGPNSEEQTRQFINTAIESAEKEPCKNYQYAAILKTTGNLIGACDLAINGIEAEIGWILHRNYWKQGFGTEMGKAMLGFGFEEHQLHRIVAHCDAENVGSYRVMEKIGLRREGMFIEGRPSHKGSGKTYGDELSYAILRDEWEIQKEIAACNSLPCEFNGFIDVPKLTDQEIELVCIDKKEAIPEKNYVPAYIFEIRKNGERVGELGLRIGYTDGLYYGGQIGYSVDEKYRGNGYAGLACRLVIPVAKAHRMTKLLISNDINNTASRRVCEKLGLRHLRCARLPEWTELYREGQRYLNIYEMNLE